MGRPFGIPVYVSPYWFIIAGVFILIYANDLASTLHGSTRFIVAAAFVVLLYVSVLIHELSHSLVARSYGQGELRRIDVGAHRAGTRLVICSSALRIPSAPGLIPTGET